MVKLEPRILKRGKQFHQMVQGDWLKTAKDGRINIEQILELKKQRKVNIRRNTQMHVYNLLRRHDKRPILIKTIHN